MIGMRKNGITDPMRVDEAFDLIQKANGVTVLSLGEMQAIVLRALAGEFDDSIIMRKEQQPVPLNDEFDKGDPRRNALPPCAVPPVDRSAQCLTTGGPVTPDHRELRPDGQQKGYVVLTEAERKKGFVRPVRNAYIHVGKPPEGEKFEYPVRKSWPPGCGRRTEMGRALAETYARDPGFYSGTFCCTCGKHFPLDQFVWEGTTEQVGS